MASPVLVQSPPSLPSLSDPHPEAQDNIQLLLHRKAELAKNKTKYALTEKDASLLLTHSIEVTFKDGDVIMKEGEDYSKVYRIKSGKVMIKRLGRTVYEISKGWFIGETLFLSEQKTKKAIASLVASGTLVLQEINLEFARHLFAVDVAFSVKFIKHIATKLTTTTIDIMSNLDLCVSSSSDSPKSIATAAHRSHKKRAMCNTTNNMVYKEYNLDSNHTCQILHIKPKELKIVTKVFGFNTQLRIPYEKIDTLHKFKGKEANITHHANKITTLTFKTTDDRDEFLGIVTKLYPKINDKTGLKTPERHYATGYHDMTEEKQQTLRSLTTEKTLKKGEILFEEGDLFQRVYTILSGSFAVKQKGKVLAHVNEGEIIGVGSLLVLRPCDVTLVADSDSAKVSMTPAYKLNALIDQNAITANMILTQAAVMIEKQLIGLIEGIDSMVNNKQTA